MNYKNFFVIGTPKSGTSLVMSLLDGHEKLSVITEETDLYPEIGIFFKSYVFNFLPRKLKVFLILKVLKNNTHIKNFSKGKIENDISGNFNYESFDFNFLLSLLNNELLNLKNFSRKNVFNKILTCLSYTINNQSNIIVEKTPRHSFYIEEILNDFSNPKFIFCERNFKDNLNSYKKKHQILDSEFNDLWCYNQRVFKYLKKNYPNNIFHISYEDLVKNPKKMLQQICLFLKVDFNEILLKPTKLSFPWYGNSMFGKKSNSIEIDRIQNNSNVNKVICEEYSSMLDKRKIFSFKKTTPFKLIFKTIFSDK